MADRGGMVNPGSGKVRRKSELLLQKCVTQSGKVGGLTVIGCAAVSAFDIFVVAHVGAEFLHARHHLAGMGWMHPVIPRGSGKEDSRVTGVWTQVM